MAGPHAELQSRRLHVGFRLWGLGDRCQSCGYRRAHRPNSCRNADLYRGLAPARPPPRLCMRRQRRHQPRPRRRHCQTLRHFQWLKPLTFFILVYTQETHVIVWRLYTWTFVTSRVTFSSSQSLNKIQIHFSNFIFLHFFLSEKIVI